MCPFLRRVRAIGGGFVRDLVLFSIGFSKSILSLFSSLKEVYFGGPKCSRKRSQKSKTK